MARFRRKRAKKAKKKMTGESPNASLAAMAPIIEAKGIFSAIHQQSLPSRSGVVVPQLDFRIILEDA